MEEILASIRRIIADDDASKPAKTPEPVPAETAGCGNGGSEPSSAATCASENDRAAACTKASAGTSECRIQQSG